MTGIESSVAAPNRTDPRAERLDPIFDLVPGGEQAVRLSPEARNACLHEAAARLSAALLHIVHQPTAKSRDRALAALVALIYGPTPFGGSNSLKEVAMRYGMSEQNLYLLMRTHRALLEEERDPEYQI